MSIIRCPECAKQVSNTAKSCPNCGFGVYDYFQQDNKTISNIVTTNNTSLSNDDEKEIKKEYKSLFITSFLFPLVGFIATAIFMSKGDTKNKFIGKECLGWSLSAFVFEMIIGFIYGVLVFFGII